MRLFCKITFTYEIWWDMWDMWDMWDIWDNQKDYPSCRVTNDDWRDFAKALRSGHPIWFAVRQKRLRVVALHRYDQHHQFKQGNDFGQ